MNSNLSFAIILLIGFVDYLGIGLVYPIFAILLFDTHQPILPYDASPEYRGAMLGILIALTPISQFFCSPILGAFSDKVGRKPALLLGISAGCLGYILAVIGIVFNSIFLLMIYRILVGASDATAAVAQATLADISTEENKVRRFAYLNSSLGLGFTLGPFLGGIIADPSVVSWFSYSTPLIAAGCLSFLNLLLVLWQFPETRKMISKEKYDLIEGIHNIGKVFLIKELHWLFFGGFALAFGWAFFNEFIPVLLLARFDFVLSRIGEFYAYTGIWYAFWAFVAGRFTHHLAVSRLIVLSLLLVAVCMVLFALLNHPIYIWIIVPFMMVGLAFAYPSAVTLISDRTANERQGEVLGVYQSIGAAAMGLSPLLAGSAIGAYPAITGWGGAFCMVLAAIGFWLGKKEFLTR